jgi:RNA polymerase sigma factor (sigma-70 family)
MLRDKLLIWQFNRGRKEVLLHIYEKYKDDLVTLAAALLFDVNSAEDVVHDVFLSLFKSFEKLRLTGSLKGYLAACVANNARNINKIRHRHQSIGLDETEPVLSNADGPDAASIFGEELRLLSQALGQLPYEQREVLMLHIYSGLKFKVIAKQQNISINTVQGRYRYALDKLRSILNSKVYPVRNSIKTG